MSTFAKVLCDSTSWTGKRLTTFHLKYPRYIHGELMTHRVFSKNSGSSRAIPITKFISRIQEQPVIPLWTENKKGMQGPVITDELWQDDAADVWLQARDSAISNVLALDNLNIHKQNVNRLMEPWMFIEIVLTGTEFNNWFELRNHKDAQPEIRVLAELMLQAMDRSEPKHLEPGEWHMPYGDNIKFETWMDIAAIGQRSAEIAKLKISVARCARVSYFNFDGTQSIEDDIALYEKLIVSEPLHASPAEHQARVPTELEVQNGHFNSGFTKLSQEFRLYRGKYVSNLSGWIQLRKLIESGEFK